jgi:hypothetical protein
MTVIKRLALAVSMLICVSVTFTAAAIATEAHFEGGSLTAQGKGGGGPLPAGQYHSTGIGADFFNSQLGLFVSTSSQQSNPLVGPSTSSSETDLSFSAFDGTTYTFGCFILGSPSGFTISRDLQTASLHVVITDATATCPGNFNNVSLPLTIDATWTGIDAVATSRDGKRYDCLTYSSVTQTTNVSNNGNATASLTPLFTNPLVSDQAGLNSNDQRMAVQGTFQSACGFGPGKGFGLGPQPAGTYHFTSSSANFNVLDPTTGTNVGVSATNSVKASNPLAGPSTSTNETDVSIEIFGPNVSEFGCYVLNTPSDFTSGLQAASLHTEITDTNPSCSGGENTIPLPVKVDVTWSGTGPISTNSDVNSFACLTYSSETTVADASNNADVIATVTPLLANTITDQSSLGTSDMRIHAQGVDQDACIFRS